MALIKCPECGKEVSSAATSCPNCGHPISGKKEKIVVEKTKKKGNCFSKVLFFVLFFIFLGVGLGMLSDDENKTSSDQNNTTTNQEEIIYTKCSVAEMVDLLQENALKAETQYKGKYLEITGRLEVIDSNGSYISLYPENETFSLTGVQCSIKNDEQKQKVMEMTKGDIVTLKGKCKLVGEVLGYSLDIMEIL